MTAPALPMNADCAALIGPFGPTLKRIDISNGQNQA
jgi:hypothetical protein